MRCENDCEQSTMARRDAFPAFPLPGKHPSLPVFIVNDADASNREDVQTPASCYAAGEQRVSQPALTVILHVQTKKTKNQKCHNGI